MYWAELKNKIYYCDGTLRNLYIFDTNIDDLKKWTVFVNKHYKIKWFNQQTQKNENQINFEVLQECLNDTHNLCSHVNLYLDNIQINNYLFLVDKIENDINPEEINSLQDH